MEVGVQPEPSGREGRRRGGGGGEGREELESGNLAVGWGAGISPDLREPPPLSLALGGGEDLGWGLQEAGEQSWSGLDFLGAQRLRD